VPAEQVPVGQLVDCTRADTVAVVAVGTADAAEIVEGLRYPLAPRVGVGIEVGIAVEVELADGPPPRAEPLAVVVDAVHFVENTLCFQPPNPADCWF